MRDERLCEWCFTNVDENDVTLRLLADGRVTLLHLGRTIEIPAVVVHQLVVNHFVELEITQVEPRSVAPSGEAQSGTKEPASEASFIPHDTSPDGYCSTCQGWCRGAEISDTRKSERGD